MSSYARAGRIPMVTFKAVNGTMFALAILAMIFRVGTRLYLRRRLHLDDVLLLFGTLCLIASTVMLYHGTHAIFVIESLSVNPLIGTGQVKGDVGNLDEIAKQLDLFQKTTWIFAPLTFTTIFAVKFGFLSFFRHLVDHLPRLQAYWKFVVAFTVAVYIFAIIDVFIACPKLGLLASFSCSRKKAIILGSVAISLDILTDMLLVYIPLHLLWKVQMKARQKFGLGAFLCLSVVMIAVAIVRISGYVYHGAIDETWVYIWQHIEACVAIIMISLTAFRSVFLAGKASRPKQRKLRSWKETFSRRKASPAVEDEARVNLTIPKPTMTGLRSFIRGHREKSRTETEQSTHPSTTLTGGSDSVFDHRWPYNHKPAPMSNAEQV